MNVGVGPDKWVFVCIFFYQLKKISIPLWNERQIYESKQIFLSDLPALFMREVFEFVTELYRAGQAELDKRHHSYLDQLLEFNPYSLNVHSVAACVDLLFWAIRDEAGLIYFEAFLSLFLSFYMFVWISDWLFWLQMWMDYINQMLWTELFT